MDDLVNYRFIDIVNYVVEMFLTASEYIFELNIFNSNRATVTLIQRCCQYRAEQLIEFLLKLQNGLLQFSNRRRHNMC